MNSFREQDQTIVDLERQIAEKLDSLERKVGKAGAEHALREDLAGLRELSQDLWFSLARSAEEKLALERERLEATLASIGDAVISTDGDGRVSFMNPVAQSLTGWTGSDALGKPLQDVFQIINERTRQKVDNPVSRVIREGTVIGLANHTVLISKDGMEVPIDDSAAPIKGRNGLVSGVVLVFRDVTERKKQEERSAHLAAIVDSSDDVIIGKDIQGVITSWNRAAARLYGYSAEEAIGKPVSILMPPDHADDFPGIMERLRRGEKVDHYETVRITKDGRLIDISLTVSPIRDSDGVIVGASAIARDITSRKLADEALRQTTQQLLLITDAMSAAVTRCSRDLRYLWVSKPYAEWLGRAPDEIIGHSIVDIVGQDAFEKLRPFFDRVLAGKTVRWEQQVDLPGTGPRWLEAVYNPTFDSNGVADGWVTVVFDVDEKKRTLQALETANRSKDEFLATVSHELRTPLNSMLGWTRLLRSGNLDAQTAARALETIERNTREQTQLVEDLLDVSRIISGRFRLDVTTVDLSAVIQEAIDSVRPAAEAKGIHLQTVLDSSVGIVSGDPTRLQQVIWNLLSNGVKFTPKGGRVQVGLARIDSHAVITVSDTGKGIAPDFLPYVFDRFSQADSTLTRAHRGLGLGLAIVRNLVELHGGTVRVASGGENQGTTFTVRLPLAIAHGAGQIEAVDQKGSQPAAARRLTLECPPAIEGVQILVVDDDADARLLLSTILEKCKATVTSVASAPEALDALETVHPDMIVSDIGLPGEDGHSFIRRVRAREVERQEHHVPAIALTAHARHEDRMRALSSGYQTHVAKPVDPVELVAVIAGLLATRRKT